jgi:4-amino-4-deoxy-L-arabinose transferase-like glycosyltransferase
LCLVSFLVAGLVAILVFEQVAHLEDEVAYLFQAQVFAVGKAYVPSPVHTHCFFAPFVLDHEGRRFGKYPPGWPLLLNLGVRMGQTWWVNAACAAIAVALTYRLGREIHDPSTGLIAAGLAASSPFLLILSGSLMSHPSSLVFVTAFLWCYVRACTTPRHGWALAAGAMLGCAFAIRPFTALAVALPAGTYALYRAWRHREWRRAWFAGLGFVPFALLVPVANAVWTGDPFLSPYVLFWPYDRVGFGPGRGILPEGNTVWLGLSSAIANVGHLATHLQGWPALSLVFVIVLFVYKPRAFWDRFLLATALSLIMAYVVYWTSGDVFGPRYVYEISSALFVLSAAGIVRTWRCADRRWRRVLCTALALLVSVNLFWYLPWQFRQYTGLYGITAEPARALLSSELHNALVIVDDERGWYDYVGAFALNHPMLEGDVIYANDCQSLNRELTAQYPGRSVYYYDGQTVRPYTGEP